MTKFVECVPITKGWSIDKKYCVTAVDGKQYLLRISPIRLYEAKKRAFEMMARLEELQIPMCLPIDFGISDEGVYSTQEWIEGQDAETIIPLLSETEQYNYGLEAGRILKQIHSIPIPAEIEEWESRFNRKIDCKLKAYMDCEYKFEKGNLLIEFIEQNRQLLKGRP